MRTLANAADRGPRWSTPYGGHETCEGCADMGAVMYAGPASAAFGGAPHGATKRVRGVPTWVAGAHAAAATEASEAPYGPRNA